MKTPKEYTILINNNKITEKIISEILFSFNKRAKNWRDKKREYQKKRYDFYNNYEKAEKEEKQYYKYKSDILKKYFKPECIHKEIKIKTIYKKIYDYEPEFDIIQKEKIIRKNSYFDYFENREIDFYVIEEIKEIVLYFLYYSVDDKGFHEPIEKQDVEKYNLKIKPIDELTTYGKEISELLSTQFCKKVYDKLMNNELEIIKKQDGVNNEKNRYE